MSQKPVLVIMAAGMGSRYGGLKQIDPVDREGDLIIDFSIFDAVEAGFEKVVFIIKKSIEKEFKEHIGNRMEKHVQVEYVYQENDRLPDGFEVPEGRVKPWGTGHAILCCSEVIDGPFAVINADDYLADIHERTRIEKHGDQAEYTEDDGATWEQLGEDTLVSMNLWGFTSSILKELKARFVPFLEKNLSVNPLKCEYFLPFVVDELLKEGKAEVTVLKSVDRWYGVTYKEDKKMVTDAIQGMKDGGLYPKKLWEE